MAKAEEGLKDIYDFWDMTEREKKAIKESIDNTVDEYFQITESNIYKKLQSETVEKLVKKEKEDRIKKRKAYIGPEAGRPAKISMWETFKVRKSIEIELKTKFIQTVGSNPLLNIRSNLLLLLGSNQDGSFHKRCVVCLEICLGRAEDSGIYSGY